jgi:alanyl-tRNA synthetase
LFTFFQIKVLRATDQRQKLKVENSREVSERYLKKLNYPQKLSGEQIWKIFKGDSSGDEISIDFIRKFFAEKNVQLDMPAFDRLLLEENEKSLRNLKNTRANDHTPFLDLASKLKNVPKTDDSFKYSFDIEKGLFSAKSGK